MKPMLGLMLLLVAGFSPNSQAIVDLPVDGSALRGVSYVILGDKRGECESYLLYNQSHQYIGCSTTVPTQGDFTVRAYNKNEVNLANCRVICSR